jgi:hypothetical protein
VSKPALSRSLVPDVEQYHGLHDTGIAIEQVTTSHLTIPKPSLALGITYTAWTGACAG